ncbi:MAG: hypothetical protein AAGA30_05530 [Planctomycetota bacterium]
MSNQWLGYEIDAWSERCPIYVQLGMHAGGETSFAFIQSNSGRSEPVSWEMKIYGPPDRLLDAVLPHEITHTIFATHFGRPLPRWADEGACTTVEHVSERKKNHQMLISFLTARPSRGIPFNRMFTMKQYPHDILPLYAQGYSVARYLIGQKGKRHFVQFLEKGMSGEQSNYDTRAWDQATQEYYGFKDLSELQVNWEGWVRSGSPEQSQVEASVAAREIAPNLLIDPSGTYAVSKSDDSTVRNDPGKPGLNSWYARQSRSKQVVAPGNDPFAEFKPGSTRHGQISSGKIDEILDKTQSPKGTIWR